MESYYRERTELAQKLMEVEKRLAASESDTTLAHDDIVKLTSEKAHQQEAQDILINKYEDELGPRCCCHKSG